MLDLIMDLLERGYMVRVKNCDLLLSPDKEYITYYNYGSSAARKSKRNLYSILHLIAQFASGTVYVNKTRSHYLPNPELIPVCKGDCKWTVTSA